MSEFDEYSQPHPITSAEQYNLITFHRLSQQLAKSEITIKRDEGIAQVIVTFNALEPAQIAASALTDMAEMQLKREELR